MCIINAMGAAQRAFKMLQELLKFYHEEVLKINIQELVLKFSLNKRRECTTHIYDKNITPSETY
jgi:hypothetical protein